jgi:hypothetical protein
MLLMRYLFTLLAVIIVWVFTLGIASSSALGSNDRFALYIALIILTLGLFHIGFNKK